MTLDCLQVAIKDCVNVRRAAEAQAAVKVKEEPPHYLQWLPHAAHYLQCLHRAALYQAIPHGPLSGGEARSSVTSAAVLVNGSAKTLFMTNRICRVFPSSTGSADSW